MPNEPAHHGRTSAPQPSAPPPPQHPVGVVTVTIYSANQYEVGGQYTHGGDIETHTDPMPDGLYEVWEIGEDETHWVCNEGIWTAVGEGDSVELTWDELLVEFGPVTDDEDEVGTPWPPVVEVLPR